MGASTKIEWADKTFNPWIGCTKVSPACDGCYAEAMMDHRYHRAAWGAPGKGIGTRSRTSAANWRQPLAWNRAAAAAGTRPFVFCASLADVFDNAVPPEWRRDLFDLIRSTPHLVWLLLTKRPQNIVKMAHEALDGLLPWPSNAAIGCTVVTQEEANRDVPVILRAKADLRPAFAFLSMEPLLGPVDLTTMPPEERRAGWFNALMGERHYQPVHAGHGRGPALDWIITGGETDQGAHKARPSHPDWFRSLRDQAVAAGVSYHHKQNGEWLGGDQIPEEETIPSGISNDCRILGGDDNRRVWRVGKHRAGRLLDGRTWDERPAVPPVRRDAA